MADLFRQFFWLIFPVMGMAVGAFSIWNEFSRQKKALEVLKVYAEKGTEPPESVLAVLNRASMQPAPPAPVNHMAQAVNFGVVAVGLAGLAIWLGQRPHLWVFTMGFGAAAVIFIASAASHWVQARTEKKRPDAP